MKKQMTRRPIPVTGIDLRRVRGGVGETRDYEKVPANLEQD
jgi:hypothetical protein